MKTKGKQHVPRRMANLLVKITLGLVLFCMFAVAGLLLWLRMPSAAGTLAELASEQLKSQGLTLKLGQVSGFLPQQLVLRDISLADREGVFLSAASLVLRCELLSLFQGNLNITELSLEEPEFFRLPQLPPAPHVPEKSPPASGPLLSLPLGIHINRLSLQQGILHAAVLQPHNPPAARYTLDLSGAASLKNGSLAAALKSSLLHADGTGLRLELNLDAASGLGGLFAEQAPSADQSGSRNATAPASSQTALPGEDSLRFFLEAKEGSQGLLALLLRDPTLPAYHFSLQGSGPVRDWQAALRLRAGSAKPQAEAPQAENARLLALDANLALQCRSGSLWKDVLEKPDLALVITTQARPGEDVPASLLPLWGKQVDAELRLSALESTYTLGLDARGPHWKLSLPQARISPANVPTQEAASDVAQVITASLQSDITDLPAVLGSGGTPAQQQSAAAFIRRLSFNSDLSFHMGKERGKLSATGAITAAEDGGASAGDAPEPGYSVKYNLAADLQGPRIRLEELRLDGLGIETKATGDINANSQALEGTLDVRAADNAPWQTLLARLAGLAKAPVGPETNGPTAQGGTANKQQTGLGGSARLTLAFALPGADDAFPAGATGTLRFEAENMRWPTPQLKNILGSSITGSARLSETGGQNSAKSYALVLEKLSAGVLNLSGRADLPVAAIFPPDKERAGQSQAGATPSALKDLKASLQAEISDTAPLAAGASPSGPSLLSGPLAANLTINGPPEGSRIQLDVRSPALTAQGTKLGDVSLRVDAATTRQNNKLSAAGTVSASVARSPGGPLSLSSRWEAAVPANNEAVSLSLADLLLQGAGAELNATLSALLPPMRPPVLNGQMRAEIREWEKIAQLAGAPLTGGPARLSLQLENTDKQGARMQMELNSLRMRAADGENPAFALNEVTSNLNASDVWNQPHLDFSLQLGKGEAGPLRWDNGAGMVKGGGQGEFSLALMQQGRSGAREARENAAKRPSNGKSAAASEILALRGTFALNAMDVIVNTLALRNPRSRTGLHLQKPLHLNLSKGLRVQDLDMAFQPGGRLLANASLTQEKMDLRADLEKLPFKFFKLFTNASLPEGMLHLKANIQGSPGSPRGDFHLKSQVSATQQVSGVEKSMDASAGGASIFELSLDGELSASPGQSIAANAGTRSLPGIVWLRGTGTLGSAARQNKEGKVSLQLPLRVEGGVPLPDTRAPMAVKLLWDGPVDALWQALPLPDHYLTGHALLDLAVTGNMEKPQPLLSAYMNGGRYQDIATGILINGITLEARNKPDGTVRALIAAADARSGKLAVEANLSGLMEGAQPAMALRGQLEKFSPLHRDDMRLNLSGIFGIKGELRALHISADIMLDEGEFILTRQLGGSQPTLELVEKKSQTGASAQTTDENAPEGSRSPTLDLHLTLPQHFFIRGMGLDSEWKGDLRVSGTTAAPSLQGYLKPVRGYLDLFSRTFNFNEGEIAFTGGMDLNPSINLLLSYDGPGITAFVRAGGSAKKPKLSLESRPPLPQDEVLAVVLFGKRSSQLSRFEAIQLANSMRELSGVGGSSLDMLTSTRKAIGLDMLRLGGSDGKTQRATSGQAGESNLTGKNNDQSSEGGIPSLEAGKYINDSTYIGIEQGTSTKSTAVRVEVELFPSINLEGKTTPESSEVGIGWKKDY